MVRTKAVVVTTNWDDNANAWSMDAEEELCWHLEMGRVRKKVHREHRQAVGKLRRKKSRENGIVDFRRPEARSGELDRCNVNVVPNVDRVKPLICTAVRSEHFFVFLRCAK